MRERACARVRVRVCMQVRVRACACVRVRVRARACVHAAHPPHKVHAGLPPCGRALPEGVKHTGQKKGKKMVKTGENGPTGQTHGPNGVQSQGASSTLSKRANHTVATGRILVVVKGQNTVNGQNMVKGQTVIKSTPS